MAIDPRIALGFQPPEQPSRINMLAQALQLQGLQRQNQLGALEMEERKTAAEQQGRLRNFLSTTDVNTPEGQAALSRAFPLESAKIIGGQLDLDSKRANIKQSEAAAKSSAASAAKTEFEARREKIAFNLQALAGVQTPEQAAQWIQGGLKSGLIDMQQASQELQAIPRDPQGFAQWKQAQQAAGLTIAQQMEQQWKAKDFGYRQQNDEANRAVQVRGQNVSAATARRGQDMAAQSGKIPSGYRSKADGTLEAIPGGPADPNTKANAANITEGERNAGGYASRMAEATKLLDQFEKGGRETYLTRAAGATPGVGSAARGEVMSADQQRYRQAAEDWVRAKLRKESGAVIGKDEMEAEIQTYFPMPWDLPGNVEQKRQAREVANRAMATAAGRGFKPEQARPGSSGSWEGWSIEPVK